MSHGSVSMDVRTGVSIDVGWKISVDGRVSSVDSGERVSVDGTGVLVDGGWRETSDELVLLSIDEEHLPLRIKCSKLAESDKNINWFSLLLLVLLGTYLKRQENNFVSESGFKKKHRLNRIKSIKRSKLPGNSAKFNFTRITLRRELLSQIRGSIVVLRDQIHKELGNLINLIKLTKVGWLCLNVKACLWTRQLFDWFDWGFDT